MIRKKSKIQNRPNSIRPVLVLSLGITTLLLAVLVISCGRKGDPRPPARMIPAKTTDLVAIQRGSEIHLKFSYPTTTESGLSLPTLAMVEIQEITRTLPDSILEGMSEDPSQAGAPDDETLEVPEPTEVSESVPLEESVPVIEAPEGEAQDDEQIDDSAAGEEVSGEAATEEAEEQVESKPKTLSSLVDPREFLGGARIVGSFEGPEIQSVLFGDQIRVRVPLEEIAEEENVAYFYAARTVSETEFSSALSNMAAILIRRPPLPPTALAVTGSAEGVQIGWTSSTDDSVVGYNVYRKSVHSPAHDAPIKTVGKDTESFLDSSALFGERYIYTVTAVRNVAPLAESSFSAEREVDFADRFAPAPPIGLAALPEPGQVRLLWEASPEDDLAGYFVYRTGEAGDDQKVNDEAIPTPSLIDRNATSGQQYTYTVRAVDQAGNLGAPSEPVSTRIP